jgi:hypothetical protein
MHPAYALTASPPTGGTKEPTLPGVTLTVTSTLHWLVQALAAGAQGGPVASWWAHKLPLLGMLSLTEAGKRGWGGFQQDWRAMGYQAIGR